MGVVRLLDHVKHLPADSALARSLRGGTWWTHELELLAETVEISHASLRWAMKVAGAKQENIPDPLVVPRPTDEEPKGEPEATGPSVADWDRFLNG